MLRTNQSTVNFTISKFYEGDVKQIVRDVKKEMCNKRIHAYNNM